MKLIYSELKKFLPDLTKEPQTLRDDLTMIGHFTNFYEKIDDEIVFDLDIKVNRPDALGYYGLARDLSVYYHLPLSLPRSIVINSSAPKLPIIIDSADVYRIQAIKVTNIKNLASPQWLQKVLKLHGINAINALVDLTNYIMLFWGIPNHAFDTAKTSDQLSWKNSDKSTKFTTLDGTNLNLANHELVITNQTEPLSLSFIGGQNSGINLNTTDSILEMATYNPVRVRHDWRQLKIVTEAGIRLEKELDSNLIPVAFNHLITLVSDITKATIASPLFDYYPTPNAPLAIKFNPAIASKISGVDINTNFAFDTLNRLGCTVSTTTVTPPSIRHDLTMEEDLAEEVIRFWGYQKIPTNQPLVTKNYPNITPKILFLIETLKDKLISLGYDEVLTWPLVMYPKDDNAIQTQNSINADHPYLRQSIIQSLKIQVDQYDRLKLFNTQLFEIGKIFSMSENKYIEQYALGMYHYDQSKLTTDIQSLNLKANFIGNFAEIILDDAPKPDSYTPKNQSNTAIELTSQMQILDANITLNQEQDPKKLIEDYSQKIGDKLLWNMQIIDIYHDQKENKYRYTFRVTYYNTDDKTAKKIHLQTFDLLKK